MVSACICRIIVLPFLRNQLREKNFLCLFIKNQPLTGWERLICIIRYVISFTIGIEKFFQSDCLPAVLFFPCLLLCVMVYIIVKVRVFYPFAFPTQ